LGRLEDISVRLAGIMRTPTPTVRGKAIIVMAGDHGVSAEGVSAYPSDVTAQMVANFLRGGAAINVLARQVGARVVVVDMGVQTELAPHPDLIERKLKHGTGNIARGPAMTRAEAERALEAGIEIVGAQVASGVNLVGSGEMGIGNTTSASAIVAALTGRAVREVTGRGTGVGDTALARKIDVIERALLVNRPAQDDALDVLAKLGGCEIAALVGVMLGAAAQHVPVLMDGFITGAAALTAVQLAPRLRDYLIGAHVSVEVGHRVALAQLGVQPLLDLHMRLGEGTGAALAMPLVVAACNILNEMATFAEANVSERAG
ncbi:MAG: nicotinate-nucleotide--dimethylbenzimidazole phosphoribosyltransferase, partial [Chloroflexi bacterium]|nr:nicotinate-nucleotide--dimethylbenzimidazole phosphoribosyltransferase [Chloroflexota bacterium]